MGTGATDKVSRNGEEEASFNKDGREEGTIVLAGRIARFAP